MAKYGKDEQKSGNRPSRLGNLALLRYPDFKRKRYSVNLAYPYESSTPYPGRPYVSLDYQATATVM